MVLYYKYLDIFTLHEHTVVCTKHQLQLPFSYKSVNACLRHLIQPLRGHQLLHSLIRTDWAIWFNFNISFIEWEVS